MNIPTFRIDGRNAVMTGAGSGMGRAIAIALAPAGADVVLTELPGREEAAQETASQVRTLGKRGMVLPLDVTQLDSIQVMVQKVLEEWGHIDIPMNNAGVNICKWAVDVTESDWDPVLGTELKGVFFCTQAVGKHMIARAPGGKDHQHGIPAGIGWLQGEGRLLLGQNRGDKHDSGAGDRMGKTQAQRECLRSDLCQHPRCCRALLEDQEVRKEALSRIPLGRVAEVEDVLGEAVFLASPASDMITGHTLVIDGGQTAV